MDFDDDMSGLQIEDLGEYFLQSDLGESWKGFSLGYGEELKHEDPTSSNASGLTTRRPVKTASGTAVPAHLTSPPMASFEELLKPAMNGSFGCGALNVNSFVFGSPPSDFTLSPALSSQASLTAMKAFARGGGSSAMDTSSGAPTFRLEPAAKRANPAQPISAFASMGTMPAPALKGASPVCQNILGAEDNEKTKQHGATTTSAKRSFEMIESCNFEGCATIGGAPEDDRGYRKKSREKMRRQEVNVKFDELIDLLGLSNRVRKSAILQEAVSAIKALKRDRDEMRRDRDRLQHEVSKLATCLQYSHLGSVAAANAVAMTQVPGGMTPTTQQLAHLSLANSTGHALQVPCTPSSSCFPIGSGFSTMPSSSSSTAGSTPSNTSVTIAPKTMKPSLSPVANSAQDVLMK